MKLARVRIEDLGPGGRDALDLDFTDPLGRVRELVVLTGPNASGKSTVLAAIAAALGVGPAVVRPVRVTCWLRSGDGSDAREATLTYDQPDPEGRPDRSRTRYDPEPWAGQPRALLFDRAPDDAATKAGLLALATRPAEAEGFRLVQRAYAEVCAPGRLTAARQADGTLALRFAGAEGERGFDALSGGEKAALSLLAGAAAAGPVEAVVLIDELEAGLGPGWQRKLLHALPQLGEGYQFVVATRSAYLRDAAPRSAVIDLGECVTARRARNG